MLLRLAAALSVAALAACGPSNVHEGHGIVRDLDRDARQIVLEHEEIRGVMPPMTMSFDVADPSLLDRLSPGQHVVFDLEVDGANMRVLDARPTGERSGAARAPLIGGALRERDAAPDFSLVDQSGAPLSLRDLRGSWVLVDFIYTSCPGPCPILVGLHAELRRSMDPALAARVRFVSISLDPSKDTPEVLASYARERGLDMPGWSFLTGPPDDVAEVVRRFGVGTTMAPDGTIDHLVATFLLDERGNIAKRWLGLEHGVPEMRAEIAGLVGPAS
jgi:protein SCO1/2